MAVELKRGDYYEDCKYHPCVAIFITDTQYNKDVYGVSLIDGGIGSCSREHCGLRVITIDEVVETIRFGPPFSDVKESMEKDEATGKRKKGYCWWKVPFPKEWQWFRDKAITECPWGKEEEEK